MPRPVSKSDTYLPGLDGIRAIAVTVVVLYHLNVPGFDGGLLGVGIFFTLSGFLITSILLRGWKKSGKPGLGTFYLRRARRLLPAVLLVILVVLAVTWLVTPDDLAKRWGQALAGTFYYANWHTITSGESYFQRVNGPGPLDHLWSLSIEEQFYLIWPMLLLGLMALFRGRMNRVIQSTLVLSAVSFAVLYFTAHPGFDNTRAYEGTDTRAGGLLIGAAFAMWVFGSPLRKDVKVGARVLIDTAGVASLVVIGWLIAHTNEYSMTLYAWGILALSIATAVLVTVAVHPASYVAKLLGIPPLRWIGERSYGIYLWHLPVIVFTPDTLLPDNPTVLKVLQVVLTLVLSALSWSLLEDPVRRHGFRAAFRRPAASTVRPGTRRALPAILTGVLAVGLVGTVSLSTAAAFGGKASDADQGQSALGDDGMAPLPPDVDDPVPDPTTETPAPAATSTKGAAPKPSTTKAATPALPQTSCTSAIIIGDSTSLGLVNKAYQPNAAYRIPARFKAMGVETVYTDVLGARSIIERYKGQPNAEDAVESRLAKGYDGCWVMALGNNEVGNHSAGGAGLDERIDIIMEHLPDQPVLWTTTRTLRTSGPWDDSGMPAWSDALERACTRYPNMRVFDWRAEAKKSWYISDRIHYTAKGWRERSDRIARGLAQAFPEGGPPSSSCVVRSGL